MNPSIVWLAALAALLPAAAAADWLVTRDGDRLETRGPWEVRGRLVVFTSAAGTLSSLRLDEVDLEASREATREAAAPPPPAAAEPPAAPPRPALVLTDRDVAHVPRAAAAAAAEPAPDAGPPPDERTAGGKLVVTAWSDRLDLDAGQLEITGSLRNPGPDVATRIELQILLYAASGTLVERTAAELERQVLPAGESTGFVATFPISTSFAAVRFDVRSRGFLGRRAEPDGEEAPDG